MKEAVCLLSKRLQELESGLSDSTLVAVAHLADFEVSFSIFIRDSSLMNHSVWSVTLIIGGCIWMALKK